MRKPGSRALLIPQFSIPVARSLGIFLYISRLIQYIKALSKHSHAKIFSIELVQVFREMILQKEWTLAEFTGKKPFFIPFGPPAVHVDKSYAFRYA